MPRLSYLLAAAAVVFLPTVALAQDVSPPALVDLQVSPQVADVTAGTVPFTITATLTDATGVGSTCYLLYRSPSGVITPQFNLQPVPGVDQYSITLPLNSSLETGVWHPFTLHLVDTLGNSVFYDEAQLVALGLDLNLTIVIDNSDITDPAVTSFDTGATAVDVTAGPASVSVQVGASDGGSGIRFVQLEWVSPSGQQMTSAPLTPAAGDLYEGVVPFNPYIEAGMWQPRLAVGDFAGNTVFYDGSTLGHAIEVTSNPDVDPPTLSDFDVTPNPIDLTNGPVDITFTASADDFLSGIARVEVGTRSPSGSSNPGLQLNPRGGGVFDVTFHVGSLEPGIWHTEFVRVTDAVGNQRVYLEGELAAIGATTEVEVIDPSWGVDNTPPTVDALDVLATAVDTTAGPQEIAVSFEASDAGFGVAFISARFDSPSGEQSTSATFYVSSNGEAAVSGAMSVFFAQFGEAGEWVLAEVFVADIAGNGRTYGPMDLLLAGFDHTISVTSDPDVTPPALLDIVSSPAAVDVRSSPSTVSVDILVSDAQSGVHFGSAVFESPLGERLDVFLTVGTAGLPVAGVVSYHGDLWVPQYVDSGTWTLVRVTLVDFIGNVAVYDESALAAESLDASFEVDSVPDNDAPVLAEISGPNPSAVDVGNGDAFASLLARFDDDLSGVSAAEITFSAPAPSTDSVSASFFTLTTSMGIGIGEDLVQAVLYIPAGSPAGIWGGTLRVWDERGNLREYDDSALAALGVRLSVSRTLSDVVGAGGTVSSGADASATAPVATTVTVPAGGAVTITETFVDQAPPAAYEFVGVQVNISATPGTVADPIVVAFDVDASLLPVAGDASSVDVFRNGFLVAACSNPATGDAIPTPCVASRTILPSGDARLVVYTVNASAWNVGVRTAPVFTFTGFFAPVDSLPTINTVRAGRAIPVKFSLGGSQGLDVLAPGYPRSESIACDSSALTSGVDETYTSGASAIQYDAAADRYVYVWKTDKTWTGCRQLVLKLTDGSIHRANFQFN